VFARQSTARTFLIGPVLDSAGAAVTTCVIGDFKISVNGGNLAALNGSATLTHRAGGQYSLAATTSDFGTVGTAQFALDKGTDACQPVAFDVLEEAVYDALIASGATGQLPANVTAMANNVITASAINAAAFTAAKFHTDYFTATAAAIWNALTSGLTMVGSIGKLLVDNINATISSRAAPGDEMDLVDAPNADARQAIATTMEAAILNEGDSTALLAAIAAKVEEFVINDGDSAATMQAIATAVWANATRELTSGANLPTAGEIAEAVLDEAIAGHLDAGTVGNAIYVGATQASEANAAVAALHNLSSTDVQNAAAAALVAIHLDHLFAAAYDPANKPGVADALLNELVENDGGVARFTANALEQSPGSSAPTANENADALLDRLDAIENGLTLRKAFRGFAAVLFGKASGSGTPSIKFRSAVTDDKERVVMAAAGNNRTSVTLDLD
jgi:hypothetical protein